MKVSWKNFKTDRLFFLKYFSVQMTTSFFILCLLIFFRATPNFQLSDWSWWYAPLVAISMIAGIQVPAVLHNAVHENIKPKFLNDIIGEIAGFFVLFGLGPFRISHILHHAHADTNLDPHPPLGKGFIYFVISTQLNTIRVIRSRFLKFHGDTWSSHMILFVEMFFYYVSLVLRLAAWYWLLGADLFVLTYVPAYLVNIFVFAHINYATHETKEDGKIEIRNLNHNFYYRFINRMGSGVYFHRNHHLRPRAYNPAKVHL